MGREVSVDFECPCSQCIDLRYYGVPKPWVCVILPSTSTRQSRDLAWGLERSQERTTVLDMMCDR